MLLTMKPLNKLEIEPSYQKLLNILLPDKSQQEKFFKICTYVMQTSKAETYLEQSHAYEQKMRSKNPKFSFHVFLNMLELHLNTQRQYLAENFSNYAEVLTSEQLQEFHAVIPQIEALNFLHTFFTFELNTTAVFLLLLLSHWHQLTDGMVFKVFLDALEKYPSPSDFEFGIYYFDLPTSDQWLAVDTRILLILAFKYLAEHSDVYAKLKKRCASWYEYILQQQPIALLFS